MRCPYCGNEMTAGNLRSKRKAIFTPGESEWGLIMPKGSVALTKDNWVDPTCKAYCCYDCRKVIVDYFEK